jgi:rhomboid protease GluP
LTLEAGRVVRLTADRRAAEEASLVLSALEIAHATERTAEGWRVLVAAEDETRARAALEEVALEREPAAPIPEQSLATLAGVHMALLLGLVYLWAGPRAQASARFAAGEADARAVLGGEWWRAVTALTLHADGVHLLGNAVFAALFVGMLGSAVGTGTALAVTLTAGAAGNLLNEWLRAPLHRGVGASTAIFGAVGALSGVAFRQRRRTGPARAWVALGAGLALLAMLGSNVESDVGAHLFGFAAGLPLGYGAARLPRLGAGAQLGLALAALAVIVVAWRCALGAPS